MMDAYGVCPQCKDEGALWQVGGSAENPIYRCDECDGPSSGKLDERAASTQEGASNARD